MKRILKHGKPLIDTLIIHHTAGGRCRNWTDERLRKSLSNTGYHRGYKKYGYDKKTGEAWRWRCHRCGKSNFIKSNKCLNCKTKKTSNSLDYLWSECKLKDPDNLQSFAMYHYTLHRYKRYGNSRGWKMVQLVKNVLYHDVGSTKNAKINSTSIAVSFCGNYRKKYVDTKAIQCAARGLRWLWDYTKGKLEIVSHKDVQAGTGCPGMISKQLHAFKFIISGGYLPV